MLMDNGDEKERLSWKEREKEYRDRILKCPFCMGPLNVVENIETPFGDEVDGGSCRCGTVFVYDRSGKKLGEAYMEAIAMAYDWDYDAAMEAADGGYEEAVARYDARHGKYLLGEGGRFDRNPKYYFVKRKRKPEKL